MEFRRFAVYLYYLLYAFAADVSASEMTCIVSGGALNSTHSLTFAADVDDHDTDEADDENNRLWWVAAIFECPPYRCGSLLFLLLFV